MNQPTATDDRPRQARRWRFTFTVRTLFLVFTVACVLIVANFRTVTDWQIPQLNMSGTMSPLQERGWPLPYITWVVDLTEPFYRTVGIVVDLSVGIVILGYIAIVSEMWPRSKHPYRFAIGATCSATLIAASVLAVVAWHSLARRQVRRQFTVSADISTIIQQLNEFHLYTGRHPTKAEGLDALTVPIGQFGLADAIIPGIDPREPVTDNVPKDPWGCPYHYEGGVAVSSCGPDRKPNTADDMFYY